MYDRILVPTDGSDAAATAAQTAVALADRFDAALVGITVVEPGGLTSTDGEDTRPPPDAGERGIAHVEERATAAGVPVSTEFLGAMGAVHETIVDYATEGGVDLIVMGTHGRTGIDRYLLGSVAERTLRASSVPVLTVHEETAVREDLDTLLVPTDGSEPAAAALDHAIALAGRTGATLHVVTVVDPGSVTTEGVDAGTAIDSMRSIGARRLQAATDRIENAGHAAVETETLIGSSHRSIVDYAETRDIDAVVMGTHGRTGLDRVVVGSVTERVVRLSSVPVVSLQPSDAPVAWKESEE